MKKWTHESAALVFIMYYWRNICVEYSNVITFYFFKISWLESNQVLGTMARYCRIIVLQCSLYVCRIEYLKMNSGVSQMLAYLRLQKVFLFLIVCMLESMIKIKAKHRSISLKISEKTCLNIFTHAPNKTHFTHFLKKFKSLWMKSKKAK